MSCRLPSAGIDVVQMEQKLGCASSYLEFHLWYLREKGWVERMENGLMAITTDGVDRAMERVDLADSPERRERKWFRHAWRGRSAD